MNYNNRVDEWTELCEVGDLHTFKRFGQSNDIFCFFF